MEEPNLEEYLKNIRDEDKENLKTILRALKEVGLEVSRAGSSLSRKDYRDIDIVVAGSLGGKPLDIAVGKLLIKEPLKIIRVEEAKESCYTYMHRTVTKRYEVELNGTKVDIIYTQKSILEPISLEELRGLSKLLK